ncbi:NAD(P)-dependent oxidoreductase [Halotalea alkalilenta]|uniref:6-phosphogluconate dehydrogenase n=1 Tax=Halotalea alkalilenta TaxID=376489 RepID=A0A172YHL2_9GAMM|nr:NAD(P)-dependent oxidoreductase [Halotalea alkalilenta]ANF58693.1 6-phosphogluconate dehydrogenase [Halotalea alkalilenta]
MNSISASRVVAFIGLGIMGERMAANLLAAGYQVRVHDIRIEAASRLVAQGATAAADVAEAASEADIVITMLPDTPQVEEVVRGARGLLAHPPKGRLYVDMSTISPQATRALAAELGAVGIDMLDAPVSGGPLGAERASLSIMVGGAEDAFERAKPFLSHMGSTIFHLGDTGAGQATKLCNQLVCAINIQAICESIALGRACGIDLVRMREVLLGGAASSWMLENLGAGMLEGNVDAGFRIDLMLKDLRLVLEMAQQQCVPLPGTSLVTTQYLDAKAHGGGGEGNQALFRVYDRMSGQRGGLQGAPGAVG